MAARHSARQLDHLFTKDLKRDIGLSFRVMSFPPAAADGLGCIRRRLVHMGHVHSSFRPLRRNAVLNFGSC